MFKIGLATLEFTDYLLYLVIWKTVFIYINTDSSGRVENLNVSAQKIKQMKQRGKC